jgi:hypothetical protein
MVDKDKEPDADLINLILGQIFHRADEVRFLR